MPVDGPFPWMAPFPEPASPTSFLITYGFFLFAFVTTLLALGVSRGARRAHIPCNESFTEDLSWEAPHS